MENENNEKVIDSRAVALDPGTMFFQIAEQNQDGSLDFKTIRNAFVELDASEDIEQVLNQNSWQYISDGKKFYVIGEDSMRVARMFPGKVELRRPMQDGILNKGEDKKMLVLSKMIEDSVGYSKDDKSVVCICVSSECVDSNMDNTFHKARLEGMLKRLKWNVKVIEEGHAVVLSERPIMVDKDGTDIPYTGIGISFGAGRTNCVLAYRGLQVIGMSVNRAGDWIDRKVSEQTDTPLSQITNIKETKLNFNNIDYDDDVIFALDAYYRSMIEYVFKNFAKRFVEVKSQFEAPIDIVIAGGTSMPEGFDSLIKDVVNRLDLPFSIKEVRRAEEPRHAVSKGCLTQAIITRKKILE